MTQISDVKTAANEIKTNEASKSSVKNLTADTSTFLKLLSAQLSHQDPLSPQEDTQFIAQLAQMSTLEEMQKIGSYMSSMQAYGLVGKYAYAESPDSETGDTNYYSGIIESIVSKNGIYYATIGDYFVETGNIVQIVDPKLLDTDTVLVEASNLIGKIVTAIYEKADGSKEEITGNVTGVAYNGMRIYASVDGVKVAIENIISISEKTEQ